MNKLIILLSIIITILLNIVESQSNSSFIINVYNNNKYLANGFCGNSTFTCNSISDAMGYVVANNLNGNQINLILDDGVYSFGNNTYNFYLFNVNITTLSTSGNVIFNGINSFTPTPLFTIIPNVMEKSGFTSNLLISNVEFSNFGNTIIQASTSTSYFNIVLNTCLFSDNYLTTSSMIDIKSNQIPTTIQSNSNKITFSNSYITTCNSNTGIPLISVINAQCYLDELYASGLIIGNLIVGFNSLISISGGTYKSITNNGNGIVLGTNSQISIIGSYFSNNQVKNSNGSVITFTLNSTSTISDYSLAIDSTIFNKCFASTGGVICATYTNNQVQSNTMFNTITNSTFSNCKAAYGGVFYTNNVPITLNTVISSNCSSTTAGGILYIQNSKLNINNSNFTANTQNYNTFLSPLLYTSFSNIQINTSTFDSSMSNAISCFDSSIVTTNNNRALKIVCSNCSSIIEGTSQCSATPTTFSSSSASSSTSTSSQTTGTSTSTSSTSSSPVTSSSSSAGSSTSKTTSLSLSSSSSSSSVGTGNSFIVSSSHTSTTTGSTSNSNLIKINNILLLILIIFVILN